MYDLFCLADRMKASLLPQSERQNLLWEIEEKMMIASDHMLAAEPLSRALPPMKDTDPSSSYQEGGGGGILIRHISAVFQMHQPFLSKDYLLISFI